MSAENAESTRLWMVIESHGLMTWSQAKALIAGSGARQATWLEPGRVHNGPLPDRWPWTPRLHAWGGGDDRLWRVLGDPRKGDEVLVTSAREADSSRSEDTVRVEASVEAIGRPQDELCRVVVSAIRSPAGASVTFIAPVARFSAD